VSPPRRFRGTANLRSRYFFTEQQVPGLSPAPQQHFDDAQPIAALNTSATNNVVMMVRILFLLVVFISEDFTA
jgi:hypothetical protein